MFGSRYQILHYTSFWATVVATTLGFLCQHRKSTSHQILHHPPLFPSKGSTFTTQQIITDFFSSLAEDFSSCYELRFQIVFFPIAISLTMQFNSLSHDNILSAISFKTVRDLFYSGMTYRYQSSIRFSILTDFFLSL